MRTSSILMTWPSHRNLLSRITFSRSVCPVLFRISSYQSGGYWQQAELRTEMVQAVQWWLRWSLSCASSWDMPKLFISPLTQSHQVFLRCPLCQVPSFSIFIHHYLVNLSGPCCQTDAERHICHFSPKQQVVTLPSLSVIYISLRDKHATLITQVSSPSLHELMSTNIRSFHAHFSIGTLDLLKSVSSTRCLQSSHLIWSTKPWHSGGKGRRPLLDICRRTEESFEPVCIIFTFDISQPLGCI